VIDFTLEQAQALVDSFGGDSESTMTVVGGDGHSGIGLYAGPTDYPEEGSIFLGKNR
jgi:hypothetical protein